MSFSAHAAFGVILDEDDRCKLEEILDNMVFDENGNEVPWRSRLDMLLDAPPPFVAELYEKYRCPEGAHLIYTDDKRRCPDDSKTVSPGDWVLGFGVLEFPEIGDGSGNVNDEEFRETADWHLWVTSF